MSMRWGVMAAALLAASGGTVVGIAGRAAPGAQSDAERSESRKFRDWIAVCDNGLRCVAIGPGLEPKTGWIRIGMEAGPDARPTVALGFWTSEQRVGTPPISLHVEGRSWPVAQGGVEADYPSGTIAAADARAVVSALADARSAEARADGEVGSLSTRGAAAALLWIDEKQGRLDTTTALVRRGDRPASRVPPPPGLPRVQAAPAMPQAVEGAAPPLPASLERLPAVIECRAETAHSPEFQTQSVQTARLDATTELWAVPCYIAAYNTGEIWFLTDVGGTNPRRLTLPETTPRVEDDPWNGTTSGGFDPETRILSAFHKGRGLADCGVFTSWVWTTRGFVLLEETDMTECWGVPMELWPTTWRSR